MGFSPQDVGSQWTTYERKDGDTIGEYAWVTELDFFDYADQFDPVEVVKKVWVLQSVEELRIPSPCEHVWETDEQGTTCAECGAERGAISVGEA